MRAIIATLNFVYAVALAGILVTGTSLVTLLTGDRPLAGLGYAFALTAASAPIASLTSRAVRRHLIADAPVS